MQMMSVQLVKSERGRDHVFINGFTFRRAYYHSTVGGWKWRCTNKKCTANIYLDNEFTIMPGSLFNHNHSPLSRKRKHHKEIFDPTVSIDVDVDAVAATTTSDELEQLSNGDLIKLEEKPEKKKTVNGNVQKSKRGRGGGAAGSGVRRKRQKNLRTSEHVPDGTHHLADDNEFPLDQCDSNTVFVNIFEDHPTRNAVSVSNLSISNTNNVADDQPENFDPLSETFGTTAFPAICDLSSKEEMVGAKDDTINLDDDDDAAEITAIEGDADDDCFLYEETSLIRNFRGFPSLNMDASKNSLCRTLCSQNPRSRSYSGSIDLSHPVDTFFFAMAQSVKRMSTVNQIKAKQMITKLITKLEMDEAL